MRNEQTELPEADDESCTVKAVDTKMSFDGLLRLWASFTPAAARESARLLIETVDSSPLLARQARDQRAARH